MNVYLQLFRQVKPQVAMTQLLSCTGQPGGMCASSRDIRTEPPNRAVKEQASGELWNICVAM